MIRLSDLDKIGSICVVVEIIPHPDQQPTKKYAANLKMFQYILCFLNIFLILPYIIL